MSLLLKQSPLISELVLYDIQMTHGVTADLSHVETPAKVSMLPATRSLLCALLSNQVSGFEGPEQLGQALKGCDLVLIPAGVPRKPG